MGLTKLIFSKTELFFNFITQSFNIIGTILIIFIMIIVNADVIGRELFLKPIAGVPMMVSMSIVAIVFLQTPQTFNRGRLTQNVSILNAIGRRTPLVKLLLDITYSIAAFFLIIPGFFTDTIGFLLLVPFTRKTLISLFIKKNKRQENNDKTIEAEVIDEKKDEL